MAKEIPTYIVGDVIWLEMRIEHEINLSDVWANFASREREDVPPLIFGLHLHDMRLREWHGISRISDVVLTYEVKRHDPPEGVYDLHSVLGLHFGAPQRVERYVSAFEGPPDVSLQIAAPSTTGTPKVEYLDISMRRPEP